jgi:N6-adenosine-specific RNA methylase IME4
VFKKGKIPIPRGARNIKQLVSIKRSEHSTKPDDVIKGISLMFPTQNKIELFARRSFDCWDSWGIDILEKK